MMHCVFTLKTIGVLSGPLLSILAQSVAAIVRSRLRWICVSSHSRFGSTAAKKIA